MWQHGVTPRACTRQIMLNSVIGFMYGGGLMQPRGSSKIGIKNIPDFLSERKLRYAHSKLSALKISLFELSKSVIHCLIFQDMQDGFLFLLELKFLRF